MRKFIFTAIMLFPLHSLAQTTFNKRYYFDFLGAVGTSVVPVQDGYYFTGVVADTIYPYHVGNFFTKLDLLGEPITFKTIKDSGHAVGTWFNTLTLLQDSSFALSSIITDSIETTLFIRLDKNGDSLFTKRFINPFYPNYDFMQPRGGMCLQPDGGWIISNWVFNGPSNSMDIYVFKINSNGEMEWDKVYVNDKRERATSILVDGAANTILGWVTDNTDKVWENFTSQVKIVKIDPEGETLWEYTTPDGIGLRDAPNDMVLLEDGSLVIASGVGTEIVRPTGNIIWFEKLLFKLSPDQEIIWERHFPDPDFNSQSQITNVIELTDGSGFVVAGQQGDIIGNSYFHLKGWLGKVSPQGQKLWERAYIGIGGNAPRHVIYDIKECPVGGFIIAGESRDGTNETLPPQQAWLLKLDQHGCLVPGCNLLDDVDEATEQPIKLVIYPNPTTDYLNFQLRNNQLPEGGTFRIVDMCGRVMHSFPVSKINTSDTFILPVWGWASGAYFLQYVVDGRVVVSEKFVKL